MTKYSIKGVIDIPDATNQSAAAACEKTAICALISAESTVRYDKGLVQTITTIKDVQRNVISPAPAPFFALEISSMITKGFISLFVLLSLALTVQALPQVDASSARPPLQPVTNIPPPPPALTFDGSKLVNDPTHPFRAPRPGDQRGPCPGLNTLANHGVHLPRCRFS